MQAVARLENCTSDNENKHYIFHYCTLLLTSGQIQSLGLQYSQQMNNALYSRDEHWTGSGRCQILLNMDWIRTVNGFIHLGSGPDLD